MLKSPGSREVSIRGGRSERHRYGLSCRGTTSSNPSPSSRESSLVLAPGVGRGGKPPSGSAYRISAEVVFASGGVPYYPQPQISCQDWPCEMSEARVERRLAAILAVDVAGYSRLMGADEEGTHERLKAHFAELVHPKVAEHRGRVVKNTGDGLLSEFASVVDAVRCAVEVQQEMIARNAATPAGHRIEFRMGINVGDIIIEASDIFGDGVNIAARLEALAEPGGICLSAAAHEQVRDRLDLAFDAKIPTLWSKMTQRDGAGYRLRPGCPDDGIIS